VSRRRNGCIFVGEDVGFVLDLIERSLELSRVAIDGVLVHDAVVHHDGEAIDENSLGYILRFEETRAVGARLRTRREGLRRRDGDCGQRA
jgi:hypothetical protein